MADTANNTSLVIRKNQPPLEDCTLSADDTGVVIGRGLIDAEFGAPYIFNALLEMRTVAFDNEDPLQRSVTLRGVEVEVEGTAFTQRFTFVVEPGTTASVSFIAAPVEVVQAVGAGLGPGELAQITADLKAFGDFGNGEIESNGFAYPIDVCNGCLTVGQSNSCIDFTPPENAPCLLGQDNDALVCCTRTTGELVCPGAPEDPAAN